MIINEILYATGWANGIHAYSLADLNKLSLEGYFVTGESMGPVHKLDDDTLAVFGKTNGFMTVNVSTACSACLPDTNNDGILSPADFSAWVAAFNSSAPACDQNSDSSCTPADFSAWVANYNAGCD